MNDIIVLRRNDHHCRRIGVVGRYRHYVGIGIIDDVRRPLPRPSRAAAGEGNGETAACRLPRLQSNNDVGHTTRRRRQRPQKSRARVAIVCDVDAAADDRTGENSAAPTAAAQV